MATDFNHLWIFLALHGHSVDHEEVRVAEATMDWAEAVVVVEGRFGLLNCECNIQGLLVPATKQNNFSLTDGECTKIADLVWHLDGLHDPSWLVSL